MSLSPNMIKIGPWTSVNQVQQFKTETCEKIQQSTKFLKPVSKPELFLSEINAHNTKNERGWCKLYIFLLTVLGGMSTLNYEELLPKTN